MEEFEESTDETSNQIPESLNNRERGIQERVTIDATRENSPGRHAYIDIVATWDHDGRAVTFSTIQYWASNNGRNKGNLSLHAGGTTDWNPTWDDIGIQDGKWHKHEYFGRVQVNNDRSSMSWYWRYDQVAGDVTLLGNHVFHYRPAPPHIPTPPKVVSNRTFTIRGVGAAEMSAVIVLRDPVDANLSFTGRVLNPAGEWEAEVTFPAGRNSISFWTLQVVRDSLVSDHSPTVTVSFMPSVVITTPKANDVISEPMPTLFGTGYEGARIRIYEADGTIEYGSGIVRGGEWQIKLKVPLPIRAFVFRAEQTYDSAVNWSENVPVIVRPATPVIRLPEANSTQLESFVLSGYDGVADSTMQVFIDLTQDKVGESTVTENLWDVRVTVPAGRRSLVAQQTFNGQPSGRSIARVFIITPAAVTDLAVSVKNATVTISGKGTIDTRLDIHMRGNSEPFESFQLTAAAWSKVIDNWLPGNGITISVRQSVSNNAGGRIYSAWTSKTFDVPVPPPTLEVEVSETGVPRFHGTGEYWPGQPAPQVEVRLNRGTEPIVPITAVSSDGYWSSSALQPWQPGTYAVGARLEFGGEWSGWTAHLQVIIRHAAPTIDPIDENSLSPHFTGTCERDAPVTLTFSDGPTSHAATVSGLTWHFQRPQPFEEGVSYTLEAVQTVDGQPSAPAIKPFTVYLERLKPTINKPEEHEEVDSDLTVVGGNGMRGASMQLWDARNKKPLGDPVKLETDGDWTIGLNGLAIDAWFITARQTLRGRPSEHSDIREFKVVVLPPTFLVPQPNEDLPRSSTLSGKGRPGGRVTVWCSGLEEPVLRNVLINPNGDWKGEVTLEVGDQAFWATQTFEGKTSKPSVEVPCRFVPHAVVAESPTPEEHLGERVAVSGFGVSGDLITLKRGDVVLGQAPVLPDRTWSITVMLAPPDGAVTLSLVASNGDFHSAPSKWVGQVGLYLPTILKPTAGEWVDAIPTFAGQGVPGSGTLVSWFNPDAVVADEILVSATDWTATSTLPIAQGAHWCRFQQTLDAGTPKSDWSESGRFDVRVEPPGNH